MDDNSIQTYVDLDPNAHEAVYDVAWAKRLLDSTLNTPLDDAAFVLCELWKSASNAFRMPLFLLNSLEAFHDGVFRNYRPPTQEIIQALYTNLKNDPILGLRNMQMQYVKKRLAEFNEQIANVLQSNSPKFDRIEMWRQIACSVEFRLGTSALREMCHNSLLSGYENYLKNCLDVVIPRKKEGSEKEAKFIERIIECFGQDVASKLHDNVIKLAREYRNVIVHNGGRVDAKAKCAGIQQKVGDEVVIPIEAVRALSERLREGVDLITQRSLAMISKSTPSKTEKGDAAPL